ncbi:MAG: hypothetical protein ACI4SB_09080, partial [Acutalibacteraceae bacterium]
FAVVLTDSSDFADKIKKIKNKFDEFNKSVYLCAVDNIRLRKGVSKEDALEYYALLQNMLDSYLRIGKSSSGDFDSAFYDHEKRLERILDFILYGIAQEEKQ